MDKWKEKRWKRIHLIEKKHSGGLDKTEESELSRLNRELSDHLNITSLRSSDIVDSIMERISKRTREAED